MLDISRGLRAGGEFPGRISMDEGSFGSCRRTESVWAMIGLVRRL